MKDRRAHLPWLGLLAGVAMGMIDLGLLTALGVSMTLVEVDVTAPVMLLFSASFGGLGFAIGRLAQARTQLAEDAERIAEAQVRLVEAEKMAGLGRMAAGVAHEVRNPLAVMRASAALIEEGLPSSLSEERQAAVFIVEEVDRLDAFVSRVLDLSRAIHPEPFRVPLAPLVVRAAGLAEVTVDAPEGEVTADPDLLISVLVSLLVNARQHGAQQITVESGQRESAGWITIADDGQGIPDAVTDTLFEPFVTTRPQGTGLGLAMGRRILEAHGGGLTLLPSTRGACFELTLPESVQ
ncbi:MAG: two-component system NtrC family sensor kinase [Myxococcota bacterium]